MPATQQTGKVITGTVIKLTVTPQYTGASAVEIGRAMSLNIQEQYRVTPVFGIGSMTAQELPILQYAGAFTCQQFAISDSAVENLMGQFKKRGALGTSASKDAFVKHLLYTEGVNVLVTYTVKTAGGLVPTTEPRTLASITGAICTGETMTIQENQVVTRNGEFVFADPVSVAA